MLLILRCFNWRSAFPISKRKCFIVLVSLMLWIGLPEGSLHAMPPVQRMGLPNHLVLLSSEDHSLPFVTLQLLIDSGSRRDPSGEEGLAFLTARGLLLGTPRHTVNQINEELDFMGASLHSYLEGTTRH